MSRLDFEFEQVLGSWLDHCSESLSLLTTSPSTTIELLQRNDQTGMLLENVFANDDNEDNDDTFWFETATETIEKFKSMIPDNMEKMREMFRVLLIRLRDTSANAQVVAAILSHQQQEKMNLDSDEAFDYDKISNKNNGANNKLLEKQACDVMLFLPKRFSGVSSTSSQSKSNSFSKKTSPSATNKTFSLLTITAPIAQHVRRRLFFWMLFDSLLQTFPLVTCQWCMQTKDFLFLVEHSLPWEYACKWCDKTVSEKWVPLFKNFTPSSSNSSLITSSSSSGSTNFAGRLETIARQRRTTVIVAQNLAAEQIQKKRQAEHEAAQRDASRHELNELYELTQRLIGALNRHKPSDGRLAIVKLEKNANNNNNGDDDNDDYDPFRVKQEMQMQLQAAALDFKDFGNTKDDAFDVDEEYEPSYVQGAEMGTLHQLKQQEQRQHQKQQQQQNQDAAASNVNEDDSSKTGGGRRAPRVRPR